MEITKLTPEDIECMDYNQLIGLTKETNRPPGGRRTVFEIINRSCINKESKVLEIGTSTGFTAIELSRLINCEVTAIDINETSLQEAERRVLQEGLSNISFKKVDVNKLPFEDGYFDLIIIGNVLSLMSNKENAFNECRRVCKKTGFLAAVPMYYIEEPSEDLIKNVSNAIHVNIIPMYKIDWEKFFNIEGLEVYYTKSFKFDFVNDITIEDFVDKILNRSHLNNLNPQTHELLKEKYKRYMFLFRDNLSKMGFTIFLIVNESSWKDPELYTSKEIKD